MILEAAQFAKKAHSGQFRKYNKQPYIYHPMRVAGRVSILPDVDEFYVAAAWLHDVVEDCGISAEEIRDGFGQFVASHVIELTNPSNGSTLPRSDRKKMDRDHIAKASVWSRRIKLIDRIDNLQEMYGADRGFKRKYADESMLLLEALRGTDQVLEDELALSICGLLSSEDEVVL